jgi:hypothetical protein
LQNGASTGNAARNAIASGLLNYVSAKLPVERLLKTAGGQVTPNTVKGILANAGLMASTDGATQIAETLTDMAINGRKSAYNQYVNELTASGYSTEAAKRQANLQFFVKDIAETMAVSGLTGGLLGAGAEMHGRRLQTAREAALAEQLAQKMAARMEGRTEPGRAELLELPQALEMAQAKKNTGYLDTPVENLRTAGEDKRFLPTYAEVEAAQQKRNQPDVRYSIETGRLPNGKEVRYVQADRKIFKDSSKTPKQLSKDLERYINQKIRKGEDVEFQTADGHILQLTGRSAYKLSDPHDQRKGHRGEYLSKDKFMTKAQAAGQIDELAQISQWTGYRKDKNGKHVNDVGEDGFHYYKAYLRDTDGEYYEVHLSTGLNEKEETIYSIGETIKRKSPLVLGSSQGQKNGLERSVNAKLSLNDSITLNGEKDNGFGRNSFGLTPDMTPAEVAERGLRTYAEDEAFQQAKGIANKLGAKLEVADLGGASGKYEDGTITLNPNSKTPVQQVLVHELTHHLESSGFYKDLQTAAIRALSEEQGISPDMLRQSIANLYEKNGVKLDAEGADRELTATFCENRLFQDEGSIQRLAQTDFNLFQKIRQWLSDVVVRLKGTAEEKRLLEVQRLYEKAARDVGKQAKNERQQGESRYRFADRKIPNWKELTKKPDMNVVDIREKSDKRFSEQRKDFLNSEEAKRLYEEPVINKDTGEKVFITPKSLKHSFNNEGQVQISAAKQIKKIIENAVLTHSEAVTHGDPSATGVYTLFGAVRTENGIQPVKLKVKEYSFNGQYIPQTIANYFKRYGAPKDYSSAYDNKVLALEDIKKEDASSSIATMPDDLSGVNYPSASSTIKVTELLGLVKGDAKKYVPKPDVRYSLEESDPLHTMLPTGKEAADREWQARKNAKQPEVPLEEMAPAEVAERGLRTYAEDEALQGEPLPTYGEVAEEKERIAKIRKEYPNEGNPVEEDYIQNNNREINFRTEDKWSFQPEEAQEIQSKNLGSFLHSAYWMDFSRVLDKVCGKNKGLRDYMTRKLEKPLMDAKNEFAHKTKDRLDGYYQDMKRLGIQKGSKESTAVMWYGEGERLNADGDVEPYTLDDLKRDFPENWKKIQEADKINRKLYDDYLNRMNAVLEQLYPNVRQEAETKLGRLKNAYNATGTDYKIEQLENAIRRIEDKEIITEHDRELLAIYEKNLNQLHISRSDAHDEINQLISQIKSGEIYRGKRILPRKDYYHHFKEFESGFSGLKNIFSEDFDIDPKMVGVSDNTKPKQKWASWMQKRGEGHDTSTDSVAGMLKYIQEAEYKIAIDPVTARFRTVIRDIADGTQATRNANRFLEWLTDYTNDLAGKTNSADRHKQKLWSRKTMKAVQWLNNRIKANAVMGNLSSAVSQVYNLPNVLGYVKNPKDITLGVKDYIQYRVLGNTEKQQAIDSSGFLTERYLSNYVDKFDESILAKPEKFAAWLLEVGDKTVAEAGWFMAYNQGMRKNVKDPVMYADDMIRRSVGGRGIGEIPLDLKSNVVKLVAPFQIEVNNAYQALREMVGKKDALGIIMILGSTYLLNEIRENYIDGRRTGLDLIDAVIEGAKNAEEKDNGIEKFGAVAGRVGGELLSNLPYGSQIASTVGITDDLAEGLFGDSDPTRFGTGLVGASTITQPLAKLLTGKGKIDLLDPAMKLLLPFGGTQAVRSKNALEDLGILPKIRASGKGFEMTKKEGAYNDDGNLKYPLDSKNPVDFLTAALLGSSATQNGKEYVKTGDGSLNKDQTKAYEKLVAAGLDQMTSWHKIKELAKIKGDKDEDGETIKGSQAKNQSTYLLDSGLSTSEQAKIYFAVVADEYTQNRKAYLTRNGVDESSYYRFLMNTRNTVGDQNENGDTISGSLEKNKLKELEKMKLNDQQKAAIYFTDFASKQHQKQMEKLEKRDVDASIYYRYLYDTKDIEKAKDENGKAISGSDLIRKLEYLEKSQKYDKETAAKLLYFDLNSDSGIVKAYDKNADQMRKKGVGGYDYLKFMAVVLGTKADKDKNGESIRNSKKKKVLAYVDAMDISNQAKDALYLSNDWSAKNLGKTPWHTGEDWSRYMPTYDYLNENYQNGTAKENEEAIYGDAVSFGGGNSSTGAELKAGNGSSGGSYYGDSGGYSRKGRKSRKKRSGRRRSGRRRSGGSSGRSSSAAANQLLRASQAMNLVNGQFDSSGYVSRVKNLMTNLGIDANNEQVPELINVLGGLTAAQKHEIYSGVGGTNTVNFDDGLTTGGGDGSLLSSLSGSGNYLPRGEDADDSLLKRLGRMRYAR